MVELLTPDVYVEEVPAGPRPIQAVGTRTAAFIGIGARRPTPTAAMATAVNNWLQFTREFTDEDSTSTPLSNAVFGFFQNGGSRCFVVNMRRGDNVDAGAAGARARGRDRDRRRARLHRDRRLRGAAQPLREHGRPRRDPRRAAPGRRPRAADARRDRDRRGRRAPVRGAGRRRGQGEQPPTSPSRSPASGRRRRDPGFGAFYFPGITIRDPIGGAARRRRPVRAHRRDLGAERRDARRPQGTGQRGHPRRPQRHPAADPRRAGRPQPGRRQLHPLLPARRHPGLGRPDARRRRQRVALPQRPAPVQHDRGVDRRGDPLDRLRAQRPAAVEVDPARRRSVPHPCLARRRADGPDGRARRSS